MINDMMKQNTIAFSFPALTKSEGKAAGSAAAGSFAVGDLKFRNVFNNTCKAVESNSRHEQSKMDTASSSKENGNDICSKESLDSRKAVKADRKDFRDCVRKTIKQAGKEDADVKDIASSDEIVETTSDNSDNKVDLTVFSYLAGALGMKSEELASLLENAGISADELTTGNVEGISAKLSAAAGLNEEQKSALSQLLNSILPKSSVNQDQTAANDVSFKLKVRLSEMEKQEGTAQEKTSVKLTVQGTLQNGDTFETAMAKLKIKLSEKTGNTVQDKEAVSQDTAAEIAKLTDTAADKAVKVSESAISSDKDSEKQNADVAESKKETGVSASEAKTSAVSDTGSADKSSTDNSSTGTVSTLNLNQLQKKEAPSILNKAETKVTVQAKDIINQVVEKAKVVNTPEKSEIMMELKPESLGKLSLKVVTEQGMVVAKFITESEQVKAILETNMQLLKDSLDKQGVNVQGLSVSVRQDNGYSAGKQYNDPNQQKSGRIVLNPVSAGRNIAGMFVQDTADSIAKSNLYKFGSSMINVTA